MLRISVEHAARIRMLAEQAYPHECCGVLLGKLEGGERFVREVVPARNASPEMDTRYSIAPEDLIAVQRRAREAQLDIIGFYHSHPNHSADWSNTDLAEAHWFACSYLIVEVDKGKAGRMCSFVLAGTSEDDKRFDDENLQIEDSASG